MPLLPARSTLSIGLACAALVGVPASAAAADSWQRLGPAPGGESFTVIAGKPYVAYTSGKGVRVAKFTGGAAKWRKVGGPVRHNPRNGVEHPALVAGPHGQPWLTWTEGVGPGAQQVRVARFAKGKWREVVGGKHPISPGWPSQAGDGKTVYSSGSPSLGFLGGRAYVAFSDFDGTDSTIRVARLSSNGRLWKRISADGVSVEQPKLATAGGRLYLEYRDRAAAAPIFRRFDAGSSSWKPLPFAQSSYSALFGGMVGFGGRLHTLFADGDSADVFVSRLGADEEWAHVGPALARDPEISPQSIATDGGTLYAAYVQKVDGVPHVDVFGLAGSTWQRLAQPTPPGSTASSALLAGAAGGGVWLLERETTVGKRTFQLELLNAAE
jgi:hypothetical protein